MMVEIKCNARESRMVRSRMNNPETLATLDTQDRGRRQIEKTEGPNRNGQSRDTGNTGYTRQRTKTVRENRRGNQEWTVQRHWQH